MERWTDRGIRRRFILHIYLGQVLNVIASDKWWCLGKVSCRGSG